MKEDVLYLEADEEITAAIDRLVNLKAGKVKIVVPKRSALLQSIVNLKLMKRAAEDAGKELILVTSDRTATHLAARVGIAVAETLKSEAKMPEAPEIEDTGDTLEAEEEPVEEIPAEKAAAAAAAMAAVPPAKPSNKKPAFARPMMVKTPLGEDDPEESADTSDTMSSSRGSKETRVPNFAGLQKKTLIAGVAVGALILLFILNWLFKTASITIYAKGAKINADFSFTVDPVATSSDISKSVLAGTELKSSRDLTATATATGKKDIGTKAHGAVTIKNCEDTNTRNLPGGSTVTANGKSFTTDAAASIPAGSFSGGGSVCNSLTTTVNVTAADNGDSYNLAPASYSSPSLTSNFRITGNQMSGGTSKVVTVLTQGDVDKARDEAISKDKETALKDLENKAKDDQKVLADSFTAAPGAIKASPEVGNETSQATITIPITYSLLVVEKSDLDDLAEAVVQKQIGDQNQLYDNGVANATLTGGKKDQTGRWPYQFKGVASAGAKINTAEIAKQIAGKKYGDAANIVSQTPGVDSVEINQPFWAFKLPSFANNIKITIKVASDK